MFPLYRLESYHSTRLPYMVAPLVLWASFQGYFLQIFLKSFLLTVAMFREQATNWWRISPI